jgi:hypothetical protein
MPSLKPLIAAWVALVLLVVLVSTALHAQAAFPAYTVGQGGTGSTTLTGILKGNGASTVGTAVAGTDYQAPVSATSPITILSNVIACLAASGSQAGCLSSADWAAFNGRLSTTSIGLFDKGFFFGTTSADWWGSTKGYLTAVTASAPLSGAGTGASPLVISQANGSTNGYLSSTDWILFNNRLSTTSLGLLDKGFFFSTTSANAYEATQAPRGTFPFTPTTNFGVVVNSTSTAPLFTADLMATGTTRLGNAGVAGQFTFVGSTGRLGVGTSTPDSAVSFNNYTGRAIVHIGDDSTNDGTTRLLVENRWSGAGGYGLVVQRNSDTPQLVVDGNGNVGVGTSTPFKTFSLVGDAYTTGNATTTGNHSVGSLTLNGTRFTNANISQWTNDAGYITSLSGAASSTLLTDANTFAGANNFTINPVLGSLTGLLYGNSGALNTAATGTVAASGLVSVTAGQSVIGSGLTVSLGNVAANTVLGNPTGASAAPTAFATSSLFAGGTPGQVLGYTNGAWAPMATATCAQITGSSGLCDGSDATASSTLLASDINTWLSVNSFKATTTMATTKIAMLNGMVVADGVQYAQNSTGILGAINACNSLGCGSIYLPGATYNMTAPINMCGISNIKVVGVPGKTILRIPQANLASFGNSFMFHNGACYTTTDVTIDGIYFEGGYSGYTAPPDAQGGGVAPGPRWVIKNSTFHDFNYFGLYLGVQSNDVKVFNNQFNGPGRGPDHIGGGGGQNIEIAHNIWDSTIVGNMIDLTGGNGVNIHHNINHSDKTLYLEAVLNSKVEYNEMVNGGNIAILSDSGYFPTHVTNSRFVDIVGNTLRGGGAISYSGYASSTDVLTGIGGDILISANTVATSTNYGIIVQYGSSSTTQWGTNIIVTNNKIYNPNTDNDATLNTGSAVINPSGINIAQGYGVVVAGNTITDDRATKFMRYGIQIGQISAPGASNEPDHVTVAGNQISGYLTGEVNRVSATYTADYNEQSSRNFIQHGTVAFPNGPVGIGVTSPDTSYAATIQATTTNDGLIKFLNHLGAVSWHTRLSSGGLDFVETNIADARLFLRA